jgi:serine/threonine-protein kinase ULK/ATG1
MKDKGGLEDLKNEIKNLKQSDHPNIVKLVEERKTKNSHYLFFEYCNGGTLSELRSLSDNLGESLVRSIGL